MTAARPDTWMPFHIGDYLADTMHLTRDQHGAYLLLLFAYWRKGGPLKDDNAYLASIAKANPQEWKILRPIVSEFFHIEGGFWHQRRAAEELQKAQRFISGKTAGGLARAQQKASRKVAEPQQTPSSEPAEAQQKARTLPKPLPGESLSSSSIPPPHARETPTTTARKLADRFTTLRDELWPGCKPLAALTLAAEAQQFLDDGASESLATAVLEKRMRQAKTDERAPPSTLRAFALSIQDAIASERSKTREEIGGVHPDGERNRWAFRVRGFYHNKFWLPDWGPKPDEPNCQAPADLVLDEPLVKTGRG